MSCDPSKGKGEGPSARRGLASAFRATSSVLIPEAGFSIQVHRMTSFADPVRSQRRPQGGLPVSTGLA